jgi:hypothetical protein
MHVQYILPFNLGRDMGQPAGARAPTHTRTHEKPNLCPRVWVFARSGVGFRRFPWLESRYGSLGGARACICLVGVYPSVDMFWCSQPEKLPARLTMHIGVLQHHATEDNDDNDIVVVNVVVITGVCRLWSSGHRLVDIGHPHHPRQHR